MWRSSGEEPQSWTPPSSTPDPTRSDRIGRSCALVAQPRLLQSMLSGGRAYRESWRPDKNYTKFWRAGSDSVRKQGGDSHGQVDASTQGCHTPGAAPDLDLSLGDGVPLRFHFLPECGGPEIVSQWSRYRI
jgi:hypothetical protein